MKVNRTRFIIVLAAALAVVLLIIMCPWARQSVVQSANLVRERYGIEWRLAIPLFAISESVFCGSIALMLHEAGQKITWRGIGGFKLRSMNLGTGRMLGWLWLNRLSWMTPWIAVIVMSFGRVPWWATGAALGEVGTTFGLGVLATFGLRLPWWNDDRRTRDAAAGLQVRFATADDIPALLALEKEVWGPGSANERQIAGRIQKVPRGNILAIAPDGRVCGFTSFCLLDYESYSSRRLWTWNDLSGHGTASTHDPKARDLFGINLGVAKWAPRETSMRLLGEVAREGIRARVRRGVLGARMPGYHAHADRLSPQEYWMAERAPGEPLDPGLRFYYNFGMRPLRLVKDYFEDSESLNWGVLVEMRVPWVVSTLGPLFAAMPWDLVVMLERFRRVTREKD